MTTQNALIGVAMLAVLTLLAGLFAMYQNPLMAVYLETWLFC